MPTTTHYRVYNHRSLLLLAIGLVGFGPLLNGCATVSTETGYVFAAEDAVDNPSIKDPFCAHIRNYKDKQPDYYAEYTPETDFTARIQLLAPRENNHITVGPGVLVPLPVLPDPWGNANSAYYHNAPEKQFESVIVAVYPEPFKAGYFFTPAQMRLDVAGQSVYPQRVTRHYSVNHTAKQQERGITREKLKAHTGEFDVYVIEFDVQDVASATATLHMDGFDRDGAALTVRDFPLAVNQAKVFDWKYDTDCNL